MAPKSMEPHDEAEEDLELERLESDLKQMAHKILDYRTTLPDQLNSTLRSILDAQRPFLSPGASLFRVFLFRL